MKNTANNKKPGKKKLFIIIALAAILIAALAVTIILITTNSDKGGEENGEVYTVSEFGTVQGKFTDIVIEDEDSAIAAVRDAAKILGLDNAVEELTSKKTDTVDNLTYYRIDQNYKGIPVYGSSFVVIADDNGEALALTGNANDIDDSISLTPIATQEQINAAINAAFEGDGEIVIPKISDDMLVIYNFDETKNAILAYRFYVERDGRPYNCIINAENGEVISLVSLYYTNDTNIIWFDADKVEATKEIISVDKKGVEYTYSFSDEAWIDPNGKHITDHYSIEHNEYKYKIFVNGTEITGETNRNNIPKKVADGFYENLIITENFFSQVLGRNGFDDRNGDIYAIYNDGFDNGKNGYSYTTETEGLTKNSTVISIGYDIDMDIDLIAHEYMHSVEATISSMLYEYESGAIMEGYSDIFGELIEDWENDGLDNDCDWKHGKRNIEDPNDDTNAIGWPLYNLYPKVYFGKYWKSTNVKIPNDDNDNGHVHHNSTVISHAAYLMTKKEDGCEALTNQEIAEVWYQTLYLLPENCRFKQLREYMLLQAELSGFSEKKIARIRLAFDMVGINYQTEGVSENFSVRILCSDNAEYYKNCRIEITKKALIGDKVVYSENATNVNTEIYLKEDKYTIRIFDKNSDAILFYREFITSNKYTDKNIVFIVENTEIPEETTLWDETTATPETTVTPETTATPETTVDETTAHVHEYATTENAATCTAEGSIISTCTCGDIKTEILPIIEHNFIDNVCSMCGLENAVYSKGLEFKLNDDEKSYSLVGIGTCTDTEIIIPSKHENLPVTNIAENTFKENNNIISVVIPKSIKTIGISAFSNIDSLQNVTFSEGLVEIQFGAFYSCDNLTKIVLPESLKSVHGNVFASCKNLKNITLTEGMIEIGAGAFVAYSPFGNYIDAAFSFYDSGKYLGTKDNPYYAFISITNPFNTESCEIHKDTKIIASEAFGNSIIKEIVIPNGVKAINQWAFFSISNLKTVKIEGTVKYLSAGAFEHCDNIVYNEYEGGSYLGNDSNPYLVLMSVKYKNQSTYSIHPDTKEIGPNAFRICTDIKTFEIPDSITVVSEYAFAECTSLTSIVIPKSVTEIPLGMFYDCTEITEFTVPDYITSIGGYAFSGCSALTKVVMKNNVKTIGELAFINCFKLNSIDFYGTEADWNKIEKGEEWDVIYSIASIIMKTLKVNIIEPTVVDVGASEGITYKKSKDGKYYYVESVGLCTDTDIVISATCNGLPVTLIESNAFKGCKNITSVTIPSSVKNINKSAFKDCTSLKRVNLAEGVEMITFLAFEGCTALEEVNIPSTCFVANGFVGCTSLKTLNIAPSNEKFKMVGNCLIYNDKKENIENALILILGEQKIPSGIGIKCVLPNAFYHSEIEEIVIPEGVTTIEVTAFDGCNRLKKVTFPESLTSIGNSAFRDCVALETIYIPKNVNALGINPFNGCSLLTSITVDPENKSYKVVENCIIDIENKKLVTGCSLSKIPNDGSVTTIGQASFSGMYSIKNIEINDYITKIESGAFVECHGIEKIIVPDTVTEIGDMVFYQMDSLTELVLGNGVTSLNSISCLSLKNLKKLTIGSGISIIEKYDLMSCKASEIVISKGVKKFEESSMCWCDDLIAIRYEGTISEWNTIEKEASWDNGSDNYTVYCTDGEIKK